MIQASTIVPHPVKRAMFLLRKKSMKKISTQKRG